MLSGSFISKEKESCETLDTFHIKGSTEVINAY
jgi:hypothetical protein